MPNRSIPKSKILMISCVTWLFLMALVALIEICVTSITSNAFRQVLRDTPLFWLYRNYLGLVLIYALGGGMGWAFLWIFSWIKGRKGEAFFLKNTIAVFGTLSLSLYGFWTLRKFLFLRGVLNLLGLVIITALLAILAGLLAWVFQKYIRTQIKQRCAMILIFVTFVIPPALRLFPPDRSQATGVPNVVLLSVDTLRPDHLGSYGYEKAHTPNIDQLASRGLLFRLAYAQIPLTAPSFSSMMTGLYPKTHGCRENLSFLDPSTVTLAEVFKNVGYRTAAFVSGYPLKRELCSLSKGFGLYQDRFSFFDGFKLLRFLERFNLVELQLERRADAVSRLSIPWIQRYKQDPFFVWIHYYDPHVPYRPPLPHAVETTLLGDLRRHQQHLWGKGKDELPPGTIGGMTTLYDYEIAYVDQDIGRILSFLEREGLREETLILFVSDHGESFDHDYYFDHGDRLYESCVRIPVILSFPDRVPQHVITDRVIQSIDLFPTILSLLKLPDRTSEGEDVFVKMLLKGKSPVYVELSRRPGFSTLGDLWSLREGSWKLIYSPEGRPSELYNLSKDPHETMNLFSKEPKRLKEMKEHLIQWMGERGKHSRRVPVEGMNREKLKSLGYLQ